MDKSKLTFPTLTLPISSKNGLSMNLEDGKQIGSIYADDYNKKDPFPHAVFDNFLPGIFAEEILNNFPVRIDQKIIDRSYNYTGIQQNKIQISPYDSNEFSQKVFNFFNSASFIQFLEGVTNIYGLIPDPYFVGGGFHEISKGGSLKVHADFRINEQLNLQRRINILIYLNKDWKDEYGGCLELWDKNMQKKVIEVQPIFNRCVIFNTDAKSFHGHPDALNCPINVKRRSIALYYYTASKLIYNEVPSHSTMYMNRPNESFGSKTSSFKLRLKNYLRDFIPPIILRRFSNLDQKNNDQKK